MKKVTVFCVLVLFSAISLVHAADVNVAPGLNTLKAAIEAAAAGDVLVLENGGVYPNQGKLDITVPLTIKAADGSARTGRAYVQQVAKADGSYDASAVELRASASFQGIHFNGNQGSRTSMNGRAIRFHAEGLKVVIDNCVLERFWLRTIDYNDQENCKLTLTNNIHLWDGKDDRIDNGRIIDFRNSVVVDSLVIENNTFLNCNDRFFRHMNPNAEPLKYVKINHNTFYGNFGYRPPFQFRTVDELIFTNNIVANAGLLGADKSVRGKANRTNEIDYTDPEKICLLTITGTDTVDTQVTMSNNNIFTEQRFTDLFALNPDSCEVMPLYNAEFEAKINPATASMEEVLTFDNPPSLDSVFFAVRNFILGNTDFHNSGVITHFDVVNPDLLNMKYDETAVSYTASTSGLPLGDLNWWDIGVSVKEIETVPKAFELFQNYPNPFNPSTQIVFTLYKASDVSLSIFNIMGKEVRNLVSDRRSAGRYQVTWDGLDNRGQRVATGVYFYKMKAAADVQIKKMIMLK